MGQTYSIYLKVEFLNKRLAASALQAKIGRAREEHINYGLDHYEEIGVGTDTIEDLLKIFFGGWDADLRKTRDGGLESAHVKSAKGEPGGGERILHLRDERGHG